MGLVLNQTLRDHSVLLRSRFPGLKNLLSSLLAPHPSPNRHYQKNLQTSKAAKQAVDAQLATGNEGKQALQARVDTLTAENCQLLARALAAEKALSRQVQQVGAGCGTPEV